MMMNMKLRILGIFILSVGFILTTPAYATSGACSSHGGVNCSMGMQLNGKVYCNDGWTDSIVDYVFTSICRNDNPQLGCNVEDWTSLQTKYSLNNFYDQMQRESQSLVSLMTQAQIEIEAAQKVTGLSAIKLPRIAQLKEEWAVKIKAAQVAIEVKKTQNNIATRQAQIECTALGDIKREELKQKLEKTKSDFYNNQLKIDE